MGTEDERDAIRKIFEASEAADPGERSAGDRRLLPGISRRAWEHPADRAAMATLRKLPGVDEAIRKIFGMVPQRAWRLFFLANAVRVTERQLQTVHRTYAECCAILDVEDPPELFVTQTPLVNAGAFGIDRPFIVLNSGTLALLTGDELRFVLGHELGHVLSDHALYKTMLHLIVNTSRFGFGFFVGRLALFALAVALREWDRKSELSGDRAGLLCLQDPALAYRVHLKMAGGSQVGELSVEAFISQAEEYQRDGDAIDSVLKVVNLMFRSHPFAVLRLAELKRWVDAGDYQRLLEGDYPRREGADCPVAGDLADAARSYRDGVEAAGDPLSRFFHQLQELLGRARGDRDSG